MVSMTTSISTTCPTLKLFLTFIILQKTHSPFASGCKVCVRDSTSQIQHTTLFACFKTRDCCYVVTPKTLTVWRDVCRCGKLHSAGILSVWCRACRGNSRPAYTYHSVVLWVLEVSLFGCDCCLQIFCSDFVTAAYIYVCQQTCLVTM